MNHHVRERAIFAQCTPDFLDRLDDMIERLIELRDSLDGEADDELNDWDDEIDPDLEPTLGAPERHTRRDSQERWAQGGRAGFWDADDAEITMPTTGFNKDLDRDWSQDMDPRLCGYETPDDSEDGHDAEEIDYW